MAQVHFEKITLPELVKSSDAILVVQKGVPYVSIDTLVLDTAGKKEAYESRKNRFEVMEVLKDSFRDLPGRQERPLGKGSIIEVYPANNSELIREKKRYMADPMPRSNVIRIYNEHESAIEKNDRFVVFIKYQPVENNFEFYVEGAMESIARKKKILDDLKR